MLTANTKRFLRRKRNAVARPRPSPAAPAIKKQDPKPPVIIPPDILGKKIKHKYFGSGTVMTIEGARIDVDFEQVGRKKIGYEFCMKNNMLEFI